MYQHLIERVPAPVLVLLNRKSMPQWTEKLYQNAQEERVHWFDTKGDTNMFSNEPVIRTVIAHFLMTTIVRSWLPEDED